MAAVDNILKRVSEQGLSLFVDFSWNAANQPGWKMYLKALPNEMDLAENCEHYPPLLGVTFKDSATSCLAIRTSLTH